MTSHSRCIDALNSSIAKMNPADKILMACARQGFRRDHALTVLNLAENQAIGWPLIAEVSHQGGIGPLVAANLLRCASEGLTLPDDVVDKLRIAIRTNILLKLDAAKKTVQVVSFLRGKGIDTMLIKGGALDVLVYDQPWYTRTDDIDLILRCQRGDVTNDELAEAIGSHVGLNIEYDYFQHHDLNMNGTLPVDFHQIWEDAASLVFHSQPVFAMCPEDMLIAACINSCRKKFFRLKSLCDIAEIVKKYPDMRWEQFVQKSRRYHCNTIVYAALYAASLTVGCDLPDDLMTALAVGPTRAALIRRLMAGVSFTSAASRQQGMRVLGRPVSPSLALPYATYEIDQIWRRLRFVCATPSGRPVF